MSLRRAVIVALTLCAVAGFSLGLLVSWGYFDEVGDRYPHLRYRGADTSPP